MPTRHILIVNARKVTQPVFVIGAPHSGAEAVGRALKISPGFHVTIGQHSILQAVYAFARRPSLYSGRGDAAAAVMRDAFAQGWQVNPTSCMECTPQCRSAAGLPRAEVGPCVEQRGLARFGDASPDLAYCAEALVGAFPDAQIIQVVRDGRDTVADMLGDPVAMSWFRPSVANVETEYPNPFYGVEDEADRLAWPGLSVTGKSAMRWRGAIRLAARLRSEPDLKGESVAVFEGNGNAARLIAATRKARKAGLETGMTLPQARAILPKLVARGRDRESERTAQEALLEAADTFSPRVEDGGEGLVYLDLDGLPVLSLRYSLAPREGGEGRGGPSSTVDCRLSTADSSHSHSPLSAVSSQLIPASPRTTLRSSAPAFAKPATAGVGRSLRSTSPGVPASPRRELQLVVEPPPLAGHSVSGVSPSWPRHASIGSAGQISRGSTAPFHPSCRACARSAWSSGPSLRASSAALKLRNNVRQRLRDVQRARRRGVLRPVNDPSWRARAAGSQRKRQPARARRSDRSTSS